MDSPRELQSALRNLSADNFESFVAQVWSGQGWSTEVTPSTNDKGIDIIANKSDVVNEKVVIQAKCYREGNRVGRPEIQQYNTLKQQEPNVDSVIVVTSSSFTKEALELSNRLNLKTVNGKELADAAMRHLPQEIISELLGGVQSNLPGSSLSDKEIGARSINTDNLSDQERQLAEIYSAYYASLVKSKQETRIPRRLQFQIDRKKGKSSLYTVKLTGHSVTFESETEAKWVQFIKTAKKYGWEIHHTETNTTETGGVEMFAPPSEADVFTITFDTDNGRGPSPRRQAKISSLIIEHIYEMSLSGTTVEEMGGGRKFEDYSQEIR